MSPTATGQGTSIDESQIPGTVYLLDLDHSAVAAHAAGNADIILVPAPSADPNDPLNWTPWRKRLQLISLIV